MAGRGIRQEDNKKNGVNTKQRLNRAGGKWEKAKHWVNFSFKWTLNMQNETFNSTQTCFKCF